MNNLKSFTMDEESKKISVMQRVNKILLNLWVIVLVFVSCVNNDDYDVPDLSFTEPIIPKETITTFKAIKSLYEQAVNDGNSTVIIDKDTDLYLEGYVVSTDKSGNFFEELIVQNKIDGSNPDNDPRLGFKIDINVSSLSDTYQFGQKVYVKMNGLTIGETSGVIAIGKGDAVTVEQIQASEFRDIVIRSNEVADIEPKITGLADLTDRDENTLIQFENMQLNRFELGATYASESFDEFDGLRLLENCNSGISMIMQTSTFSDFKALIVPQGKGSVTGVFSRDFRDNFNVLIINSSADVNFDSSERCDPLELTCGLATTFLYVDYSLKRQRLVISRNIDQH